MFGSPVEGAPLGAERLRPLPHSPQSHATLSDNLLKEPPIALCRRPTGHSAFSSIAAPADRSPARLSPDRCGRRPTHQASSQPTFHTLTMSLSPTHRETAFLFGVRHPSMPLPCLTANRPNQTSRVRRNPAERSPLHDTTQGRGDHPVRAKRCPDPERAKGHGD